MVFLTHVIPILLALYWKAAKDFLPTLQELEPSYPLCVFAGSCSRIRWVPARHQSCVFLPRRFCWFLIALWWALQLYISSTGSKLSYSRARELYMFIQKFKAVGLDTYYRKTHCLTIEFHEAMSAISVFPEKFNVKFTSNAVNFSLNA